MARRATTWKSAQRPPSYQPMAATLVEGPFDHPDWVFEPKFDGLRVLVRFDGRELTLLSRNDRPQEALFPEVAAALRQALSRPAVLDGEIVCFDDSGRTSFRALQQRFHLTDPDEARAWAQDVAARVAGALPDTATVEVRKAKRGARVYIDVLQNARGHHAVPPYVLRAVAGATVSTPLRWSELKANLRPERFTLRTVPARLARLKEDPMAPLVKQK